MRLGFHKAGLDRKKTNLINDLNAGRVKYHIKETRLEHFYWFRAFFFPFLFKILVSHLRFVFFSGETGQDWDEQK